MVDYNRLAEQIILEHSDAVDKFDIEIIKAIESHLTLDDPSDENAAKTITEDTLETYYAILELMKGQVIQRFDKKLIPDLEAAKLKELDSPVRK